MQGGEIAQSNSPLRKLFDSATRFFMKLKFSVFLLVFSGFSAAESIKSLMPESTPSAAKRLQQQAKQENPIPKKEIFSASGGCQDGFGLHKPGDQGYDSCVKKSATQSGNNPAFPNMNNAPQVNLGGNN